VYFYTAIKYLAQTAAPDEELGPQSVTSLLRHEFRRTPGSAELVKEMMIHTPQIGDH